MGVAPQDEAMIRILSRLAVENNWWSFSVNPTPTGKQFIVQPQSQWERDRERQQAKEGSAPPQPVPAATSAAAPPAAPTGAATPAQRVARGVDQGWEGRHAGQVHHEEPWPQAAGQGEQEQAERAGRWPFWHQREPRARTAALPLPLLAACQITTAVCACFRV